MNCNQNNKEWKYGHVYVIDYGDQKTFKIGYTTVNPEDRLKQIARSNVILPMKLVMSVDTYTNAFYLENIIQMALDDNHISGEWFNIDFPKLIDLYKCLKFFGNVQLYRQWYEIVPPDYDQYILNKVITDDNPPFIER